MNVIQYAGVTKRYNSWPRKQQNIALENFSLQIKQGEVLGFLGPNGAGKSTALKLLLNFIHPTTGSITLLGKNVSDRHARTAVGYLPENPFFYDYLTAEEILWFGGSASGLSEGKLRSRAEILLDRMGLTAASKRPLRTYSKGMVQRAGLALALIHDPDVVVLDEPMSGLDPIGRKLVSDLISELRSAGKTVFFSSHVMTDVERLCDRAAIIVGGRLRLVGTMDDLLAQGATLEDVFMQQVQAAEAGDSA